MYSSGGSIKTNEAQLEFRLQNKHFSNISNSIFIQYYMHSDGGTYNSVGLFPKCI